MFDLPSSEIYSLLIFNELQVVAKCFCILSDSLSYIKSNLSRLSHAASINGPITPPKPHIPICQSARYIPHTCIGTLAVFKRQQSRNISFLLTILSVLIHFAPLYCDNTHRLLILLGSVIGFPLTSKIIEHTPFEDENLSCKCCNCRNGITSVNRAIENSEKDISSESNVPKITSKPLSCLGFKRTLIFIQQPNVGISNIRNLFNSSFQ